jgi:RND family efflux transporter MFP subunit
MTLTNPLAVLLIALPLGTGQAFAQALDCVVKPKSTIQISAGADGLVTEVLVTRGDTVEVGDILVRLDDELERLQHELTRTRADDQGQILSQQKRLEFRQKELERAARLSSQNVTSETVREDAEIEVFLTELAVEEAKLAQKLATIEANQAAARLERRSIESPAAGTVTKVETSAGEYATEQTVLLSIAEIDPLHVEVFASLDYFETFRIGAMHTVRFSPPLTGAFAAEVTVVDRVFDASSGTFGVRLEIPNPDGKIPTGVRCTLDAPAL